MMTEEVKSESKAERDTPKKVREDLVKRIEELEAKIEAMSPSDNSDLSGRIDQLTNAIIDSAHLMGWPKDVLESHGLKPFDKRFDKLKIRQ